MTKQIHIKHWSLISLVNTHSTKQWQWQHSFVIKSINLALSQISQLYLLLISINVCMYKYICIKSIHYYTDKFMHATESEPKSFKQYISPKNVILKLCWNNPEITCTVHTRYTTTNPAYWERHQYITAASHCQPFIRYLLFQNLTLICTRWFLTPCTVWSK